VLLRECKGFSLNIKDNILIKVDTMLDNTPSSAEEFSFKGTPGEFAVLTVSFLSSIKHQGVWFHTPMLVDGKIKPDVNPFNLTWGINEEDGSIKMVVKKIANNQSMLSIWGIEYLPHLTNAWELLKKELNRMGLEFIKMKDAYEYSKNQEVRNKKSESGKPPWVPKKEETLLKWKHAYEIIVATEEEFKMAYRNLETENPKPSIADLRDALKNKLVNNYSDKTVRRIRFSGKKGWLK
jgi:hypothetical protein